MTEVLDTSLPGVRILIPQYYEDARGWYTESYSSRTLREAGLNAVFVQDGHSFSAHKGILRGIHLQLPPRSQTKLVRCTRGRVLDAAVDLREDSPCFRQWVTVELSAANRRQLWIPRGFGHAFLCLEDNCEVQYKVDNWYYPETDRSIAWNDPALGISWPEAKPLLSPKDAAAPTLAESGIHLSVSDPQSV